MKMNAHLMKIQFVSIDWMLMHFQSSTKSIFPSIEFSATHLARPASIERPLENEECEIQRKK